LNLSDIEALTRSPDTKTRWYGGAKQLAGAVGGG